MTAHDVYVVRDAAGRVLYVGCTGNAYYYDATGRCLQTCSVHRVAEDHLLRPRQREGLPDGDPRHGTCNGYINHGCRCAECRTANTAERQAQRARKRGAA